MKFIFPALWILLLGVSTIRLFFWGDIRTPPPWIFLFFWIAGSALWLFDAERLKYVSVDDDFLYVSNYFREIVIPLQDIYDVTGKCLAQDSSRHRAFEASLGIRRQDRLYAKDKILVLQFASRREGIKTTRQIA